MNYDAFISYSRRGALKLAPAVQSWLERYAKPWWHRRAVRVFRDETDLSAQPEGWPAIERALQSSEWFVLFLSPDAAASKWVKREARLWLGDEDAGTKGGDQLDDPVSAPDPEKIRRLLLILESGPIAWDDDITDFDWTVTDCVPRCFSKVFSHEPFWVDMGNVITADQPTLDRSNPEFITAIARLAARIRGLDLTELIGEDSRRHRQAIRTAWGAGAALGALTTAVTITAVVAAFLASAADSQKRFAVALGAAAEARALAVSEPARIAEAAEIAASSYQKLQEITASPPVPVWFAAWFSWINQSIWSGVDPIASAVVKAQLPVASPAHTVLLEADALLPMARHALKTQSKSGTTLLGTHPTQIIAKSFSNGLEVWDLQGEASTLQTFAKPTARVNGRENFAASKDGRRFALEDVRTGELVVLSSDSNTELFRFRLDPFLAGIEPRHPAAKQTGGQVTETFIAGSSARQVAIAGLAMDQDGDQLAVITKSGQAVLLHISVQGASVTTVAKWTLQAADVSDLMRAAVWELDPAGRYLAMTPSSHIIGRAPVYFWQTDTGAETEASQTFTSSVNAIAFDVSEQVAAIGTDAGEIIVVDLATGERKHNLRMAGQVEVIAFGSGFNTGLIAAGADRHASVFDLKLRTEVARMPLNGRASGLAWAIDTPVLTTSSLTQAAGQNAIYTWDLSQAVRSITTRLRTSGSVSKVAIGNGTLAALAWPRSTYAWDLGTGAETHISQHRKMGRFALGFDKARDAVTYVSLADDAVAVKLNLSSGASAPVPGPGYSSVATTEGTPYIASASIDADGQTMARLLKYLPEEPCRIEIWDLETSARTASKACGQRASNLRLSADGKAAVWFERGQAPSVEYFAVAASDRSWTTNLDLSDRAFVSNQIAFSPDGSLIAVAHQDAVSFLDAATGRTIFGPFDVGARTLNIALGGTPIRAVIVQADRHIVVVDPNSGRIEEKFPFETDTLGDGGLTIDSETNRIWASFGDSNELRPRIWSWPLSTAQIVDAVRARTDAMGITDSVKR